MELGLDKGGFFRDCAPLATATLPPSRVRFPVQAVPPHPSEFLGWTGSTERGTLIMNWSHFFVPSPAVDARPKWTWKDTRRGHHPTLPCK
jgi:hypothetical protein